MIFVFIAEFGNARLKTDLARRRPKHKRTPKGIKTTKLIKYLNGHVQNVVSDTRSLISRVGRQFVARLPWDNKSVRKLFEDGNADAAIKEMETIFAKYNNNFTVS